MNSDKIDSTVTETAPLLFLEKNIVKERRKKNRLRLYRDLVITAAVIFVLFSIIAGIAIVQGDSMKPSLTDKSVTAFYRLSSTYEQNDIVIFQTADSDEVLIKRIAAVAGDVVDIDNVTGTLLVNHVAYDNEVAIGKTYTRENGISFPYTVPEGCVFVLGDNRETAVDSRDFGAVSIENIIGKVVFQIKILTH